MLVEQYFVYECQVCERSTTLTHEDPVTVPRCPGCGTPITGQPEATIERAPTRDTQGFFECFDCGHTFGYYDAGNESDIDEPRCTNCGSENVSEV